MRRNKVFRDVGDSFFFGCEGGCKLRLVAMITQAAIGDLVAATGDHVTATGNPVVAFSSFFY